MRRPAFGLTLALAVLAAPRVLTAQAVNEPGSGNTRLVQVAGKDCLVSLVSKSNLFSKVVVRRADNDEQVGTLFTPMVDRVKLEQGRQDRLAFPDQAVSLGIAKLKDFDFRLVFNSADNTAGYTCTARVDAAARTVRRLEPAASGTPVTASDAAQDDQNGRTLFLKLTYK